MFVALWARRGGRGAPLLVRGAVSHPTAAILALHDVHAGIAVHASQPVATMPVLVFSGFANVDDDIRRTQGPDHPQAGGPRHLLDPSAVLVGQSFGHRLPLPHGI